MVLSSEIVFAGPHGILAKHAQVIIQSKALGEALARWLS